MLELTHYESYKQICSPTLDKKYFAEEHNILDRSLELFRHLLGNEDHHNMPIKNLLRLAVICKSVGKKPLKKIDIEIFFKKLTAEGTPMNFKAFYSLISMLVELLDSAEDGLKFKMNRFFDGIDYHSAAE